jgi:hypothetical protein
MQKYLLLLENVPCFMPVDNDLLHFAIKIHSIDFGIDAQLVVALRKKEGKLQSVIVSSIPLLFLELRTL